MKRIFLDYASSTPIASEVIEAMKPWMEANWANPSALYTEAIAAKEAVSSAREEIAAILSTQEKNVYFTSGGTESNNLAITGVIDSCPKDMLPHVITSAVEHPAILEVCENLKKKGCIELTILPVSEDGIITPASVRESLKENTVLVSIMYANNEIGTVQNIHTISRVIQDFRYKKETGDEKIISHTYPYFHTDACQAALYLPLHVLKLGVDLMTLDGIKMYGPRGSGILYVRDGVQISAIVQGGGQERGLRSGTENVSGIVGLACAMEIAEENKEKESARLTELREYAIERILEKFPDATLNGSRTERLPNNINICFPGIDAEFTVISLDVAGVACSYSSSCRTLSENSSSYVVRAIGKPECADSSLRFTMGRETTKDEIDQLVKVLCKVIKK